MDNKECSNVCNGVLETKKLKVLAVFKNPAPYFDPLFRLWSSQPDIDLTVVYCVKTTDGETYYDTASKKKVKWGERLLNGYKYLFLSKTYASLDTNDLKITSAAIKGIIKEGDYDVILLGSSYWSLTTWYTISAAKKKGIPIVTRMTVEAGRKRNKGLLTLKKILVGRYCKSMSAGVYECRQQKEYMEHYGMKSDQLFSAPCAVNNAYFIEQSRKFSKLVLRNKHKIPDDAVVFISTAMLTERKSEVDVIKALMLLKDDGYEPYYFMVGDGPLRENIEGLIEEQNLSNVHIMGMLPQDEMSKFLKMSDVYILPSKDDASPKALNEAMNFELPIVITTGVGTRELLLNEGVNGFSYTPGDVGTLCKYMRRFLEMDKEELAQMGRKSIEIVAECNYNKIVDSWTKACRYAISKMS